MRSSSVLPFLLLLAACGTSSTDGPTATGPGTHIPLFTSLPGDSTGIAFANTIEESPSVNYFTYIYAYNGGGVAAGDVNNDGLADLYFTGNQQRDRLYLNKGGMRFEDITEKAIGSDPGGWRTGVSMADVNGDGFQDIYVCRSGPTYDTALTRNLLYLNNGDLTFREAAHAMGVADTSHSIQGAFFDLEGDGDLDLYVINHPKDRIRDVSVGMVREAIANGTSPSDRLFVQDGGRFHDATRSAGVTDYSYSLGLAAAQLDDDDRPDLYVANDFDVSDAMYTNVGDGTFREVSKERTRHMSNFGMGCDVADVNNDALPDIMVLDMTADDHQRNKTNMGSMSPRAFWTIVASGQQHQYMLNSLQLNNGNGTFSEIAQLAGVARTDWSWAPLLADLDNDGWKDLMVTNGFKHDIRNNDYQQQVYQKLKTGADFYKSLDLVPSSRLHNYLFRNNGADEEGRARLTFADSSQAWGFTEPVNSNGAAYADLDNDGDLDLVINNIDAPASVYANSARQQHPDRHYVRFDLCHGKSPALNTRVVLRHGGTVQYQELSPVRGYQSSVESVVHFGLGPLTAIDSVEVFWPNGKYTLLRDVKADQLVTVKQEDAGERPAPRALPTPFFASADGLLPTNWQHREDAYDDFQLEVLLPHKQSENGPMLAVGDADGDGTDDLFIGGAHGSAPALFLQQASGTFASKSGPWEQHKDQEQLGAVFLDADGDGDQDLLVMAGSNEQDIRSPLFTQRLYRNEGQGRFSEAMDALPPMTTSAQRAAVADIDNDGDLDIYLGGRQTPAHYPFAPRSYLLVNDGKGRFADATPQLAPTAMGPGMVTDARFADIDGDHDPDLVLSGEWMPITVFGNNGGHFENITAQCGLANTAGWWNTVTAADLDGDGDVDLVGGNLGWNSKFKADAEHPLHVYWADMDGNGRSDIVLAKEKEGKQLPVRGRECSSQQCPVIMERFPTYEAFAKADLSAIYTPERLEKALHLTATHMRSAVFLNDGSGGFTTLDLPVQAQLAPIQGIVPMDVNADGRLDLIVAGNHWGAEVETVRYDAGTGLVLLGDGKGSFAPTTIARSGFFAWGNVKDLALVRTGPDRVPTVMVANNNDRPQAFRLGRGLSALSAR